ncbi:MAG: ABC transporter substrate-binding protein [Lachnospiraceae bacterium]|nr:ABC transporter substrate-binding protein [Lachnospiraceae bacterium]
MKKTWKRLTALFLCLMMILSLTACGSSGGNTDTKEDTSQAAEQTAENSTAAQTDSERETYIFTDSTGREVELPVNITRAACGGPLANIMIYAVNPDVIVGWSSKPSETAQKYIDESLWDLPEYGKFYGNSEDFNREALMASAPEVIIDVGEWDEEYKADLDALQEQLGIPVILVEANLEENPTAFRTMGKLLGQEERGEELASYCETVLKDAQEKAASIPEEDRVTVYYGEGEDGLSTMIAGTIHAQIFELVGAQLVVQQDDAQTSQGGGSVSMEQLMAWDPDVIAFASGSIYETVSEDETWKALKAISENNYFEIPAEPYNWIGRPPGPNRMIGIRWLGNMLYPEVFDYDIEQEVKDFFHLFYRYDLTDEEVQGLLGNSTLKN